MVFVLHTTKTFPVFIVAVTGQTFGYNKNAQKINSKLKGLKSS